KKTAILRLSVYVRYQFLFSNHQAEKQLNWLLFVLLANHITHLDSLSTAAELGAKPTPILSYCLFVIFVKCPGLQNQPIKIS
uniref:hypothetical protein n=1 Tax=Bacillus sp. OTU530 TaxID=3043862 RepID=UPI00313C71C0